MTAQKACFLFLLIPLLFPFPLIAQSANNNSAGGILPGRHRGEVTALLLDMQGRILSAGEDGFLGIWNREAAVDRFQLCPYSIRSFVLRPGKSEICIVESDGYSLYRVSAWNYETRKNLFTLRFRDSISFINYSAAGNFLIVARSGRTGVAYIHAETGEVLESPEELSGSVAFAETSRSEKVMICYFTSGILSYWNIESGIELQHLIVPPNIRNPVLFGNYCFFGGFDSRGLVILDAVTGAVLARDETIKNGIIFNDSPESMSQGGGAMNGGAIFNCLSSGTNTVYRMEINQSGRFTTLQRRSITQSLEISSIISAGGGSIVAGTKQGALYNVGSSTREMRTGTQERILDIAASSKGIAFITERGSLGHIPLDFINLNQDGVLTFENSSDILKSNVSPENISIISDSDSSNAAGVNTAGINSAGINASDSGGEHFLLWQTGSNRSVPVIKSFFGTSSDAAGSQISLDKLSMRYPIRSAAVMGDSILFLDTTGSVYIVNRSNGNVYFTYSAAGAVEAAFIDQNTIIIGRSSIAENTPFMLINTATGETVPLSYPAMIGARVFRGSSGAVYGAVVNQAAGNINTSIVRLNTSDPSQSEKLIDYSGEDSVFSMTESGGNLASTLGGSGAALYRTGNTGRNTGGRNQNTVQNIIPLERSAGLPVKIVDGGRWLIVLDGEGSITWHNNQTGELLAVYRLIPNTWYLSRGKYLNPISGRTVRKN